MDGEERHDEDEPTQDRPKGNDDDAKGSQQADDPEIGRGTGEGKRGLGEQTGATGGGQPTEPEDATPERRQDRG